MGRWFLTTRIPLTQFKIQPQFTVSRDVHMLTKTKQQGEQMVRAGRGGEKLLEPWPWSTFSFFKTEFHFVTHADLRLMTVLLPQPIASVLELQA